MSLEYHIGCPHLGDRGSRDNFWPNEEAFYRFLDWVQRDPFNTLVIHGDLFEGLQCNLSRILLAYRDLLERFCSIGPDGAEWIVGNHDNWFIRFAPIQIEIAGIRLPRMVTAHVVDDCLFCHGHEADPYCRSANPGFDTITAVGSALWEDRKLPGYQSNGAIEDAIMRFLERPLNWWRAITRQPSRLQEMIANVETLRKQYQVPKVITGHTHEAGQFGDHHFNVGDWCRDRNTYAVRDTVTKEIWLCEWMKSREVPFVRNLAA